MRAAARLRAGFMLAILMLVLNVLLPLVSTLWISQNRKEYDRQQHLNAEISLLLSALKDGETGQRGFAITGRDDFLSPLYAGYADVDRLTRQLNSELVNDPELGGRMQEMEARIAEQRTYFSLVIDTRRASGLQATSELINQGNGKRLMEGLRDHVAESLSVQQRRIVALELQEQWRERISLAGLMLIGVLDLVVIGMLFHFTFHTLRESRKVRNEHISLSGKLSEGVQRLEQRNLEVSLLSRMAGALHSVTQFDECYTIINRFAKQLFPHNSGCLALYHPSRDILEGAISWGDWPKELQFFEPNACWAIRRGQSHAVLDPDKDLICPHLHDTSVISHGYVCVPLMAQGEPLGVLTLDHSVLVDLELAEAFAEQVSLGVANLSLRDSLRQQSLMDALTGLHNRRFLDETLRRELLRASRNQFSVAVVLLDVDHFKRFNDTFGHEAGDLILRHLALEMKRNVRGSDLACRYGGEEFALVLPEISMQDAIERCEHLRLAVSRLQVRYGGQPLGPITISLGLAWFPRDGTEAEALLHNADLALYRAKNEGRNRLCVFQAEIEAGAVNGR
ncbi:sensor domain-containing diguanylate cyclase [Pseudomonas sp. LRF_L74]|uniref:sensor domain-containing diguanylate cyclase n=1 Tax=Pseudomonas sp. LRF_L74 TaxID=3369422 RepID=UPI003F5FCF53